MAGEHVIVVAVEDLATAGAVASKAVRQATHDGATSICLVHVLDEHTLVNGMLAVSGAAIEPVLESREEAERLLGTAEGFIRAEYEALGRTPPAIGHWIGRGRPGEAIAQAAKEQGAQGIVLGARRPHLFGRLTHADVGAHITSHAPCRIHVAPLQEAATSGTTAPDAGEQTSTL